MSRRPRLQRLELAAPAAVWGVLALALGIHLAGRAPDDMFITFRYAWNLAHGNGFVFNPGERIFGLTNPGLGLLLGGLHWVTRVPVHLLATGVYAASLWALAMLVWSEARRRGFRLEAAVGGTLVIGSTFLWLNQGSAGATVLALLAGSAVAAERRPATAGLLAGLAVWFRPDAALGVLILGLLLWASADRGRRLPWRWGLAAAGVILAGVLVAWLWFGTLLPGTLHAKQVMADARETSWAGPTLFWARGAQFLPRHWGPAWLLVGAGGLAGLWPLAARGGRAVRALVLYGAAVAIAYPLLGVPFFSWYAVPTVVAALYGLSALACGVGRALDGHRAADPSARRGTTSGRGRSSAVRGAIRGAVVVLLLAVPVASIARVSARWLGRDTPSGRYATYREAALWIRQHTGSGGADRLRRDRQPGLLERAAGRRPDGAGDSEGAAVRGGPGRHRRLPRPAAGRVRRPPSVAPPRTRPPALVRPRSTSWSPASSRPPTGPVRSPSTGVGPGPGCHPSGRPRGSRNDRSTSGRPGARTGRGDPRMIPLLEVAVGRAAPEGYWT